MTRFLCPLCEYSTVKLSNLRVHFKAKHNPYCFSCNKSFKKFSHLSMHCVRKLRDEYHHVLLYLSCRRPTKKLAETVSALIRVEEPETKRKWFLCPLCNYKARRLGSVKVHFKLHKPHCPFCNRNFKSMLSLVNHCLKRVDEHHLLLLYLAGSSKIKSVKNMIELGKLVSKLIGIDSI